MRSWTGVLDVLNSAVGVVSPLLGGLMMGAVGSGHTPHAGAILHALLACVLVQLLPVNMAATRMHLTRQKSEAVRDTNKRLKSKKE